ncbi:MAG: hypothetical protein IJS60_06720 [Abditibacteriota bacterium]|nr:hypothetical protein [Abditibacteriota bacterium]
MPAEVNYKVKFTEKYFKSKNCDFDIDKVDIVVKNSKKQPILYIESKNYIFNEQDKRKALAQIILTDKKQTKQLTKVALIFKDKENNDNLIEIDCSEDSILHNNDFNWDKETPSNPTKDAIDRINDRIHGHLRYYKNEEIKDYFNALQAGKSTEINITKDNFITIYKEWKNEIKFNEEIKNEQDFINLFIVDILNGTKYENEEKDKLIDTGLTISGTRIDNYEIRKDDSKKEILFLYKGKTISGWTVSDIDKYNDFWRKYKRPPQRDEFIQILELHSKLYSDKYRRTTGSEYTPYSFVELQNKKLKELGYNMEDYIVFDPCCGVGNLQNDFGKDYKNNCYMSTLEQMDVDVCKTKGFENVVKFDFLTDDTYPVFKYKGTDKTINEICEAENKKLIIIMNPPYQNLKGHKDNLAIEFFNKCVRLQPQTIVFYYMTESFLRDEVDNYIKSKYKIVSHVFSNAQETFLLSNWPISMVIFDKNKGKEIDLSNIEAERYELDKASDKLVYVKNYCYDNKRPNLIDEIDKKIKQYSTGSILGNYSYMDYTINLTNKDSKNPKKITLKNLEYCLLSKGIDFNTHNKYFERKQYVYKGTINKIPKELYSDSICFAIFYKCCAFTNKGHKNFIMPFTASELGCNTNDLNVLLPETTGDLFNQDIVEEPFDFREFLKKFEFSQEAKDLFEASLEIFKYYHNNTEYTDKDWNDSFYDITNAIMGKDASDFKELDTENDTRINKVKTTKGTKGFSRKTIKYAVNSKYLPIFIDFFDKRDILARKINKQLVDNGLLLWERENIY